MVARPDSPTVLTTETVVEDLPLHVGRHCLGITREQLVESFRKLYIDDGRNVS